MGVAVTTEVIVGMADVVVVRVGVRHGEMF